MTATNSQQKSSERALGHSPLKVVPPTSQAKVPAGQKTPLPVQPAAQIDPVSSKVSASLKPYGSWAIAGFLVLGLGAIAYLPIPNYVTGEAQITSRMNARQRFTMPIAGTVKISVQSNQIVSPGQLIAEIISPDLESQIANAERVWEQAKGSLSSAEQQLIIAQTRLEAAQKEEAIANERVKKRRQEIEAITSNNGTPKIRQLEREIEGVNNEIAGLQNEKTGIHSEIGAIQSEIDVIKDNIAGLSEQLQTVEHSLMSRQKLVEEGAIGAESKDLLDLRMQKINFQSQINQQKSQIQVKIQLIHQKESQSRERDNQIAQKNNLIQAKSEQIKEVQKEMHEVLDERENEVEQRGAAKRSAQKEVEAAATEIQNIRQLVLNSEVEFKRLQSEKKKFTLTAQTAGTVLTPELDLKNYTTLEAGQEILQLVDLHQLTATVRIRQEDTNLVKIRQPVMFKSRDPLSPDYQATVQDILPIIGSEQPGTNPMATLQILINNENNRLLPGGEGYAHIKTGEMRVYHKVQHELSKLFQVGKYFPWLSSDK